MVRSPHRPTSRHAAVRLLGGLILLALALLPLAATTAQRSSTPADGVTWSGPPPPGSKSATAPPASDPAGVTWSGPARPGRKNDAPQTAAAPAIAAAGWRFTACGSALDGDWTTTSAAYQPIRSCTLTFSEDGVVYLSASTSLGLGIDGEYEARFSLSIDSQASIPGSGRWVNVYDDGADGTDKILQVSTFAPVSAGTHTFHFMGARFLGAGAVQLYDPSLSMLYFPASSADVKACGVPTTETWTTTASTLQEIRSCWLDLPRAGFAYVSATASVGLSSGGAYEGLFRLGVDDINGLDRSSRWVNVYPDSSDGSDEAIASSLLTEVTAGSHTFSFSGMRSNGAGTVKINNSNLSVLYFPAPNATLNVCGTAASDDWNNATDTFSVIRGCTLNVPRDSFAFVDASASAKLDFAGAGNEWEGHFRLGIDNINGASATDRWVNVYNDGGNGTDRSVAQSMLFNVSRGPHTFAFVGRRFAGGGTVRLVAPILSVLVPGDRAFLPAIRR